MVLSPLLPAAHHARIIEALEAVASGGIPNLILQAPPGSAKSTYTVRIFIGWWLLTHPTDTVLFATHSQSLADYWGGVVRRDVIEYGDALGIALDATRNAVADWYLTDGGRMRSVSVGTNFAGVRANLIVVDDPLGSAEDAMSETTRENQWRWFVNDLLTRGTPTAPLVLMQQRMHESDIAGRLLEQVEAGTWPASVLSFPAVALEDDALGRQPGELLWPGPYSQRLEMLRAITPPWEWSAKFQQDPTPLSGDYFQSDWLIPYDRASEHLRCYGASDYAVTDRGGDFTCHLVVGMDPDARMYLLDLWRGQTDSGVWVERLLDMAARWKVQEWAEEGGQIAGGVNPLIVRRMHERRIFFRRRRFPSKHDKAIRAQAIRGRMAVKGLYVPTRAPWYAAFFSELMACWKGKYDDQADALSLAGQLLDHALPARLPTPEIPAPTLAMPATITPGPNGSHLVTITPGWLHPDERRKRQERSGMWRDRHGVLRRAD
jgi:predicted phage terminase large subunit-like protein